MQYTRNISRSPNIRNKMTKISPIHPVTRCMTILDGSSIQKAMLRDVRTSRKMQTTPTTTRAGTHDWQMAIIVRMLLSISHVTTRKTNATTPAHARVNPTSMGSPFAAALESPMATPIAAPRAVRMAITSKSKRLLPWMRSPMYCTSSLVGGRLKSATRITSRIFKNMIIGRKPSISRRAQEIRAPLKTSI